MSTEKKVLDQGGHAFPLAGNVVLGKGVMVPFVTDGLTIRQHIAIEAMKGLLSNEVIMTTLAEKLSGNSIAKSIVSQSCDMADEMIEHWKKEQME